jgi:ribA/ribD-fused uncharacterized protein
MQFSANAKKVSSQSVSVDPKQITSFTDRYSFLSNFHSQGFYFIDQWVKSAEHAYQASKASSPHDFKLILEAETPRDARELGQKVGHASSWFENRQKIMLSILECKFSVPNLRQMLIETDERRLIEGNNWGDRYWGCVLEDGRWVGENHLGRLLMQLRDSLVIKDSVMFPSANTGRDLFSL